LLSSAEAKYKALSDLSQEMVYINTLANETKVLNTSPGVFVFVNNKAAIDLANSKTAFKQNIWIFDFTLFVNTYNQNCSSSSISSPTTIQLISSLSL